MTERTRRQVIGWAALSGGVYGIYYTLGLVYFETYVFSHWVLHLPVWVIFGLQGGLLASRWLSRGRQIRTWRKGVEFVCTSWVAGAVLFGYSAWVSSEGGSWKLLGLIFLHLGLLSLHPLVALLVLAQGRRPRSKSGSVKAPTPVEEPTTLAPAPQAVPAVQSEELGTFHLLEEKAGEDFKVPFADLVLVEAADNYCKFHFFREGKAKTKTLRITLKEVEGYLASQPGFHRCHRSYLVNASRVEEVLGTSQAHRLKIEGFELQVPVSRSFEVEVFRKA
jgi:hypothetical protein